jgi:hypothetical protein
MNKMGMKLYRIKFYLKKAVSWHILIQHQMMLLILNLEK